jgi:dienelactone hydrolase
MHAPLRHFAALLALLAAGAATGQAPMGGARVELPVRGAAGEERIVGYLYLPPGAGPDARLAAIVIVHGSGGVRDTREGFWARELSAFGVAALVTDSFTPRGVASTVEDQTQVTTAQMARDAFGALRFLAAHPAIDGARVAIMGMSKGGSVALQVADRRDQQRAGAAFAAYVPLYPSCTLQYRNPRIAGPMLVLIGAEDDYVGLTACREYVERVRAAGGRVALKVYPGAQHAFDGDPSLSRNIWLARAQNYRDCVVYLEDDGRMVTRAGTPFDPVSAAKNTEILRQECLRTGATVGSNAAARAQALEDIKIFLKTELVL